MASTKGEKTEPALNPVEILKQVPGIGDKTAEQILETYPDLKSIYNAKEEEISEKVKGISVKKAQNIKAVIQHYLPKKNSPLSPRRRRVVTDIEFVPSKSFFKPPVAVKSDQIEGMDVKDLTGKTVGEVKRAVRFQDEVPPESSTQEQEDGSDDHLTSRSIFFPKKKQSLKSLQRPAALEKKSQPIKADDDIKEEEKEEVELEESVATGRRNPTKSEDVPRTPRLASEFATFQKRQMGANKKKTNSSSSSSSGGSFFAFFATLFVGLALLGGGYFLYLEFWDSGDEDLDPEIALSNEVTGDDQVLASSHFAPLPLSIPSLSTPDDNTQKLVKSTQTLALAAYGVNPSTAAGVLPADQITVRVLNGSGISGEAGRAGNLLEQNGLTVTAETNADRFDYDRTLIYYTTGKGAEAVKVKEALASRYNAQLVPRAYPAGQSEVVVVVIGDQ